MTTEFHSSTSWKKTGSVHTCHEFLKFTPVNPFLHQQCCSVPLFSDSRLGKGGDEDKSTFAAASLPINSCR